MNKRIGQKYLEQQWEWFFSTLLVAAALTFMLNTLITPIAEHLKYPIIACAIPFWIMLSSFISAYTSYCATIYIESTKTDSHIYFRELRGCIYSTFTGSCILFCMVWLYQAAIK